MILQEQNWALVAFFFLQSLMKEAKVGCCANKNSCLSNWINLQLLVCSVKLANEVLIYCIFTVKQGYNTIKRNSTQSTVTIPFERTFRDLDTNRPTGEEDLAQFNFCGCGWPQHLLIPKGTAEGMLCELFVMISNYDDDKVEQNIEGACNDAGSYCGIKDKLYPDRRSMGYPFDRLPREGVSTLEKFLTSNMRVTNITINFKEKTVARKENS